MQWYFSKNGIQQGPVQKQELQAKLSSGEIAWADLVWRDGMSDWTPAAQVEDLSIAQAAAIGSVASSAMPPHSPYVPVAAYSPVGGPAQVPVTNGLAIASLVLGISIVLVGVFSGVPAVICGHMALAQIQKDPVRVGGRGMAIAGLVLGYISIAMTFLLILVCIVMFFSIGTHSLPHSMP